MTFYVLHDADGKAVSMGTVIADPLPDGLTAKEYDSKPDGVWDSETLDFTPAAERPKNYTPLAFLRLFTAAERIAIRASDDIYVQDFLYLLERATTEVVNTDPDTIAGVQYLASQGLITVERASEVLS